MQNTKELVQEIIQMTAQYRAEVSSKRKPWPNSIVDRVEELIKMGLSVKKVSDLTGIPYFSILNWRHRTGKKLKRNFHPVAVTTSATKAATVTVPVSTAMTPELAAVTVTSPDGYQIKLKNAKSALEFICELRRAKCF